MKRTAHAAGLTPGLDLAAALRACGGVLAGVVLFSGLMSVLTLAGPLFMLQVYDRVVPSRSIATLLGLGAIVALLYVALAFFDQVRARIFVRAGTYVDEALHPKVFQAVVSGPLRGGSAANGLQPLRDLDQIRGFIAGGGPASLCDLPFLPLQLLICFLIHPLIGWATVFGAGTILGLTLVADATVRRFTLRVAETSSRRLAMIDAARRNAEVVRALGMNARLADRWTAISREREAANVRILDRAGGLSGVSRIFRMMFQSFVLGVGAYLVIAGEASFGVIVAASILSARALQPAEQFVAHWRGFVAARQGWQRLKAALADLPAAAEPMTLPAPTSTASVESLSVVPPGSRTASVTNVGFALKAGSGLGIIGPSGAGKSSLARALVGSWRSLQGRVRLDGATLDQWEPDALGRHIGYLPQDVELFAGTIAENIARFEPDADPSAIVAAARAAAVHEMILRLPTGYSTEIGEGGSALSAGQRQRIGLARALYRDPFLVVLDEPNSNLDAEGDAALTEAIRAVRRRGGIVVVVAHRPGTLESVDMILAMANGNAVAFGPKEEVLRKVLRPAVVAPVAAGIGAAREAVR